MKNTGEREKNKEKMFRKYILLAIPGRERINMIELN